MQGTEHFSVAAKQTRHQDAEEADSYREPDDENSQTEKPLASSAKRDIAAIIEPAGFPAGRLT